MNLFLTFMLGTIDIFSVIFIIKMCIYVYVLNSTETLFVLNKKKKREKTTTFWQDYFVQQSLKKVLIRQKREFCHFKKQNRPNP